MVRLKVYDAQEKVAEIELGSEIVTIGRDPGNVIALSDASVSRKHAQVEPNGNFYLVRDNGSTNGTFVNEMLVRVHLLGAGDVIRVGKYLVRVDAGKKKRSDSTHVRVEQLSLTGPRSGIAEPAREATTVVRFEGEPSLAEASHGRLVRLHEIQGELGHVDAVDELLERALDLILAEVQGERGSILRCEKVSRESSREPRIRFSPVVMKSRGGQGTNELVIPEELLVQVSRRGQGLRTQFAGEGDRFCLLAPLKDKSGVRAVVYVDRSPPAQPFSREELQFLTALASQVAVSLSNAVLFAEASDEKDKVRAVMASLTDGVIVTSADFGVLEANASAAMFLGLRDRNFLGAVLFDLFSGFKVTPEVDALRASSRRDHGLFHLARPARPGDEDIETFLSGRIAPFPAGAAEPRGFVVTIHDCTDVRRIEALKSEFIGNVAHKLRSPLTVIQGNLPLLKGNHGESAQIIEELERNSAALCHIVEGFTEFAEMELRSTKLPAGPEPTRLKAVVRDAAKDIEPLAQKKGIVVVDRVKDSLPPVVARPERLVKAFRHLLENAIKFSSQQGRVVVESEASHEFVRVDVIDDGPGIPRDEIESVFYLGHQVDKEHTGQVPGAGLGLTMARHIVQEHGGEIRITSPFRFEDHGTRVSVILPAKAAKPGDAARESEALLAGATKR